MTKRIACAVFCIVIAFVSIFILELKLSSPEFNQKTIEALEEKRNNVLELSAGTVVAATTISALPGDATTPIGNEIASLASYFLIALCAVLLEKYLLTIAYYAAFRYIIPIALVFLAVYFLVQNQGLKRIACKLFIFGICITAVVPASVKVSGLIEQTYQETSSMEMAALQENLEAETEPETVAESETEAPKEKLSLTERFLNFAETVKDSAGTLTETAKNLDMEEIQNKAKTLLNHYIEATAVFLLTSCVVPVLVLVSFVWLLKIILEVDISTSWANSFRDKKKKKLQKDA